MYNYVLHYRNPNLLPDYLKICGDKKIPWNWKLFDYFTVLLIVLSCLNLAVVVRYDSQASKLEVSPLGVVRLSFELIFFILLFLEICIRIRASPEFFSGKDAYLRNPFNIVDLFVLACWVIVPAAGHLPIIGRSFRTFRTLRIIYIFRDCLGINLLWKTLKTSIPTFLPVTGVILCIMLYLATAGLMLCTRYQTHYCVTADELAAEAPEFRSDYTPCYHTKGLGTIWCRGNDTTCEEWHREYHLELVVYTDIWKAMFVVFQLMTLEGWSSIAYSLSNKVIDFVWPYLILIIFFGSWFGLNLITGVILTEYKRVKQKLGLNNETDDTISSLQNYPGSLNDSRVIRPVSSEYNDQQESNSFDNKYYQQYGNFMNELHNFIENFWIKKLILVFIMINTFILALRRHNESLRVTLILQHLETMFVALFLIETLMKLLTSKRKYFSSVVNCVDFVTIMMSVIFFFKYSTSFGLTACRLIHVFQLFDYTSYADRFQMFAVAFKSSFKSHLLPLCLVYSVAIVIFATIGYKIFPFKDITVPYFFTMGHSLITTFQLLSGESWTTIRQSLVSVSGASIISNWYFVLALLTGRYILLNVLLAYATDIIELAFTRNRKSNENLVVSTENTGDSVNKVTTSRYDPNSNRPVQTSGVDEQISADNITIEEEQEQVNHDNEDQSPPLRQPFLPCNTLFVFSRKNWLRKAAHYVVNLHYFDLFMMYTVLINALFSCMLLGPQVDYVGDKIFFAIYVAEFILKVVDTGLILHSGSYFRNVWNVVDLVTILPLPFVYVIEITDEELFSNIGVSEIGLLYSIRFVRLFRVFTLSRKYFPKLRPAFQCIIKAFTYFPIILIIYFVLHFIFSLIAVHLFGNRLMICEHGATSNREFCRFEIVVSNTDYDDYAYDEVSNEMYFKNYIDDYNITYRLDLQNMFRFDNVLESMVTLFAIQSGQDWSKITDYLTVFSNRTVVHDPVAAVFSPLMVIFYLVYLVIFSFFFTKLFSALVICTYRKQKVSKFETCGFNKNQTDCIDYVLNMKSYHKYIPSSDLGVRRKAWNIVNSSGFEQFILLVITLNALMFMMNIEDISTRLIYLFINFFVAAIYVIECVLKITAYKCGVYFDNWWNVMDFVIVLSGIIDMLILIPLMMNHYVLLTLIDEAFDLNFLKTIHLFRLVRYIKSVYVNRVLFACKKSFKSLLHVFFPLGVLILVYASVGENVFRCFNNTHLHETTKQVSTTMNTHFNFLDIFHTIFLLLRTATGEHWMWTMKHSSPISVCGHTSSPFGSIFTHVYFISFVFLSTHLMMNLFPAMIVDNFSNLVLDNSVLGEHNLSEFVTNWMEYDPKATRKIHFQEFIELLKKMSPPLGLGRYCPSKVLHTNMMKLHIPVGVDGKIGYKVSLFALVRAKLDIRNGHLNFAERKKTDDELRKTLKSLWPHVDENNFQLVLPKMEHDQLTIAKLYAGRVILDYWRRHRVVELE